MFEDASGKPDPILSKAIMTLLQEYSVPIVVLNACRSAMLDYHSFDPFTSVALSLINNGINGVVAMSYSLHVSGGKEFFPAFYSELFKSGDLSIATLAGRKGMYEQTKRTCRRGRHDLRDFLVPVIYQQSPFLLQFQTSNDGDKYLSSRIQYSEEAISKTVPAHFIGRDHEILQIERAMQKNKSAILIHGLGGVGKTALSHGFLNWLKYTDGMDMVFWLSFVDIKSTEYVFNTIGKPIFGADFLELRIEEKFEKLVNVFKHKRYIIVWDNFEFVRGVQGVNYKGALSDKDQLLLFSFLKSIGGGKSKIIINSCSEEKWIEEIFTKVSLRGFDGEERWEYLEAIIDSLGFSINREDKYLIRLTLAKMAGTAAMTGVSLFFYFQMLSLI